MKGPRIRDSHSLVVIGFLFLFSFSCTVAWIPSTSSLNVESKAALRKLNDGWDLSMAHSSKENTRISKRQTLRLFHDKQQHPPPSRAIFPIKGLASVFLCVSLCFANVASASPVVSNRSSLSSQQRYWDVMETGSPEERVAANRALMDYAVGTINTMYYDNSGGANFQPREFFAKWREWLQRDQSRLESRDGTVAGMVHLVNELKDPYCTFLTREELKNELITSNDGFLGLGAIVEPAGKTFFGSVSAPILSGIPPNFEPISATTKHKELYSADRIAKLPVITAVVPHSPAERTGLTVGDRVIAVAKDNFMSLSPTAVDQRLMQRYHAENYVGYADLTVAKPVYATGGDRDVIVAYRPTRVRLGSASLQPDFPSARVQTRIAGGNAIVYYELLNSDTDGSSIFESVSPTGSRVGYIRLTRFSRASTAGYIQAVNSLEQAGATAYIIDLRNNYGGVIQEAMLTASTLLRDPHDVLCFTLNSRGGFSPHDVEEYVVDKRYPGYFLSRENPEVTLDQVRKESPGMFAGSTVKWSPPSAYASLHEQRVKRAIHQASLVNYENRSELMPVAQRKQFEAQKKVALLVNEGTASSAEVFTAALHDNGRLVAVVGSKTYGKGLIQHTFPLPDGAGLRLTVAEYLTPALQHVTKVGGARYDQATGLWVGSGIQPDVFCSSQSIPSNIGSDFCVGTALGVLEESRF